MTRVLVDINVVLDVLLDREPNAKASSAVWVAVETRLAEDFLAAHAVTTIHYLVRKEHGQQGARRLITAILKVFRIAAVDDVVLKRALELGGTDFEDCVTASAAEATGCSLIVTRDPAGFRSSPVRVATPEAAAALLVLV